MDLRRASSLRKYILGLGSFLSIKETFVYVRDWHNISLTLIYAMHELLHVSLRVTPRCVMPSDARVDARVVTSVRARLHCVMPQLAPNLSTPPSFVFLMDDVI